MSAVSGRGVANCAPPDESVWRLLTAVSWVLAGVDTDCLSTYDPARAQVAELVDALVSGTSGASREGSSPFLGTNHLDPR